MVTTPMPATARKRSEQYAKNVTKRGHVKKSLSPRIEKRLEEERLRKNGIKTRKPALSSNARKVIVILLLITLGSALYQILQPLFSSSRHQPSRASRAKTTPDLTRQEQAKAAEAILRAMNREAAEKYMKTAKDYKPPAPLEMPVEDMDEDYDYEQDDDLFAKAVPNPETKQPLV
ncbi:hypothetical protein COEREDRAFT_83251 [Coemansia reversa NRRL 1564]|uniref:Stress-associated endoplasmic reticulum protein n=1 Tax=Coemansia reversa (strain ATCC 12441 / NRRL 1564) TaxID=763665 RepID=A0A2G5B440_COERN|nr:hypothetical protein COEREDRAFT_83251 [Coemansia reversa NRRL 1564]|eukprot:PIA13766.1 hypothetical protein COEREDRAFT_83251 [Coemansia reversa NRRL 1564]